MSIQQNLRLAGLSRIVGLSRLFTGRRAKPTHIDNRQPPEWDVSPEDRGRLSLFLLLGQSNMSGRGSLNSAAVPLPHPSIYAFNKDYRWHPAREPLGTVPEEVDWIATDGGTGAGPGLAFARQLVRHWPTWKIGLIPCARGSSSIEQWQPERGQNTLYGACIKRALAASTYGTICGVLVSQGESDAGGEIVYSATNVRHPRDWAAMFTNLVNGLRDDLHDADLPVLFSQLGPSGGDPSPRDWDVVKEQQASVKLPGVAMIRTDDLEVQPDGHFSTESNVEIGNRFAGVYVSMSSERAGLFRSRGAPGGAAGASKGDR